MGDLGGGWRVERAWGGAWCAVKTVPAPVDYGAVGKVRRRRPLGVPDHWKRSEVESWVRAMVARGELD